MRKHRFSEHVHTTYTVPEAFNPFWGYHERDRKAVVALCAYNTAGYA